MAIKTLYYFGRDAVRDLANVPSGANYRLISGNRVVVFDADYGELSERTDKQGRALFGPTSERPKRIAPDKTGGETGGEQEVREEGKEPDESKAKAETVDTESKASAPAKGAQEVAEDATGSAATDASAEPDDAGKDDAATDTGSDEPTKKAVAKPRRRRKKKPASSSAT